MIAALLAPAMPQPLSYHHFADTRGWWSVPNVLDVTSNVGFLIAGIYGVFVARSSSAKFEQVGERIPYFVFALGMLLTAAGSSYYHLAPDNDHLFWDRLPMTIAFMSLIAAQIVDRISIKAGLALLLPLLVIGAASVVYWRITEDAGNGNVIPYGLLQAYSAVILVLIAVLYPSRYTFGNRIYWVFLWYVIAKILEQFDQQIFSLLGIVSGHSLKHLAAGVAGLIVCRMLLKRDIRPRTLLRQ